MAGNTGFKKFTNLELYYPDDGSSTGTTKLNVDNDPDYIAPTYDLINCVATTRYYNTIRSIVGIKNDCGNSSKGGTVSLTAIANQFVSLVSLADANSLADNWLSQNIQDYVNTNGNCTYIEPCGNWSSYINPLSTYSAENQISGYLDFWQIFLPGEAIDPTTNIRLDSYFTVDGLFVEIPSTFYQSNTFPGDFQIGFEVYFNQDDLSPVYNARFKGTIVTNFREILIDVENRVDDTSSVTPFGGATFKNNCNGSGVPVITVNVGTYYFFGTSFPIFMRTNHPQGPNTATNTGTGTSYTFSYRSFSDTSYGPSPTPPIYEGKYIVTVTVAAHGIYSSSSTSTIFSIVPVLGIKNPTDVKIDSLGNIYVTNTGSNNIIKILPNGISTIFAKLSTPKYMVIDSNNNIYVTNYGQSTVSKITPNGIVSIFGNTGASPNRIAMDSNGNIYTTNSNSVSKILPNGTSTILVNIPYPSDVKTDTSNNVYVTDWVNGTIRKILPNGTIYMKKIDSDFYSDSSYGGYFNNPPGISFGMQPSSILIDSNGTIYTADNQSDSISKWYYNLTEWTDVYYRFRNEPIVYQLPENFYSLYMTIDSYDNIYISRYNADNSGNYYVLKVLPNGTSVILGNTGKNPIGIAVSSTGTVYVANNSFGTIAQTEYLTII